MAAGSAFGFGAPKENLGSSKSVLPTAGLEGTERRARSPWPWPWPQRRPWPSFWPPRPPQPWPWPPPRPFCRRRAQRQPWRGGGLGLGRREAAELGQVELGQGHRCLGARLGERPALGRNGGGLRRRRRRRRRRLPRNHRPTGRRLGVLGDRAGRGHVPDADGVARRRRGRPSARLSASSSSCSRRCAISAGLMPASAWRAFSHLAFSA